MVVGFDVNTHLVAWAILTTTSKVIHIGQAELDVDANDRMVVADCARDAVRDFVDGPALYCIEVNNFPSEAIHSIENYRRSRWLEGRVLQALGLRDDDIQEIHASPERKKHRRRRMELKFSDQLDRRLSEDEIDALAVADSGRFECLKRGMTKGIV